MITIIIITFLIDYLLCFIYNIHMFQLNFYNTTTQIEWICKNKIIIFKKSIIYLIILIVAIFSPSILWLELALYLIKLISNLPKKAKKPLVYTQRVKRTIFVGLLLCILILLLWKYNGEFLYILPLLSIFTPFIIIASDDILMPLHKYINKKYEKKAIEKINGMKNLIVIGITGSYGKTSTKNFLYDMLNTKYNCYKTPGNINTKMGIIKDINENLKATHEVYICEMGADHTGDIRESCNLVKPRYGIITSIGKQHLETFKTVDNIINTKFELADAVKDGIIFLNNDSDFIRKNKINQHNITYSIDNKSDYKARDIKCDENGMSFKVKNKNGKEREYITQLLGKHNILNILGAIAICDEMGVDYKNMKKAVLALKNVPHRLEMKRYPNKIIIDDAYNSNPVGAKSALETLINFKGIKIIITPGMVELGKEEYKLNYEFGVNCASVCDYIILVGKKQTIPVADGVKNTKFDLKKLIIVDTIEEAFKKENEIKSGKDLKIVLLENDLPDQY